MAKTSTATATPTPTATPAPFSITQIPGIMRHKNNNMIKGAELMEEWFRRGANNTPATAVPVTNVITMKWVLGFTRAKQVYDKMIADKMWSTPNAKKLIEKKLRQQGKIIPSPRPISFFRSFSDPVDVIDIDHIQEQAVGSVFDPVTLGMDDLMAALNFFILRMAVWGTVSQGVIGNTPRHEVLITDVAVYVRDSYDFNDNPNPRFYQPSSQPLGCWDATNNAVGMTSASGTCVANSDFRAWRAATIANKNGLGGDFLVFSDLEVTTLNPPDKFYI